MTCKRNVSHGDIAYFHYSGHGAQIPSSTNDGFDGILCPMDMIADSTGWECYITEQEFHAMVQTLPLKSNVTITLDCCHSGTSAESVSNNKRDLSIPLTIVDQVKPTPRYIPYNVPHKGEVPPRNSRALEEAKRTMDSIPKNQYEYPNFFAACRENQTAADYPFGDTYYGGSIVPLSFYDYCTGFSYFFYATMMDAGKKKIQLNHSSLLQSTARVNTDLLSIISHKIGVIPLLKVYLEAVTEPSTDFFREWKPMNWSK